MIKVYLDWNVMSQMKQKFHSELLSILSNNNKFYKPYSSSHVSDILSSFKDDEEQIRRINEDLNFISLITDDIFIFNNGNKIELDFAHPYEYYSQRVEEQDSFKDLSIDGLFGDLEKDETFGSIVKPFTSLLKNLPLDDTFKEAFKNPQSAQQLESMFPGLKDNLTMEGFFQSMSLMITGLNENEDYKDLRKIVQSGLNINRDRIFDDKTPYTTIEKVYKQFGSEYQQPSDSKHAPEWFNKITQEYISLDMHGYQEDKVNTSKGRKETFKNTVEDSFHCAFASTCDFYVINDNKSFNKSQKVYEKLHINTKVMKPNEFVQFYNENLSILDDTDYISLMLNIIRSKTYIDESVELGTVRKFLMPHFIFDYFNEIAIIFPNNEVESAIALGKTLPVNGMVYIFEIVKLCNRLLKSFGQDIDNLGEVREEEFGEKNWVGRRWQMPGLYINLVDVDNDILLYFATSG